MIESTEFRKALETLDIPFLQLEGDSTFYQGWKLSIQGKTLDDAMFLFSNLITLLIATKSNFKFGTQNLIDRKLPQQSTKLLTIYIPDNVDPKSMAELVRLNLLDYKGAEGIEVPESYSVYSKELGIYFRNDRDEDGRYVPAN